MATYLASAGVVVVTSMWTLALSVSVVQCTKNGCFPSYPLPRNVPGCLSGADLLLMKCTHSSSSPHLVGKVKHGLSMQMPPGAVWCTYTPAYLGGLVSVFKLAV